MFWGLSLRPARKYSQVTAKAFHISNAALEDGDNAQVYVISEKQKFLICNLSANSKQAVLDLNFEEGEDVCFVSTGNGSVSLIGYLISDGMLDYSDDEDTLEQAEVAINGKVDSDTEEENAALEEDDSDAEEDDDGEDEEDDDDDDSEDDDDEEEEDAEEEEEIQQPKAKKAKVEQQPQPKLVKENGAAAKLAPQTSKKAAQQGKKEETEKPVQPKADKQKKQTAGGERTLSGNVKVEDICIGNGPEVKQGKHASMYYIGRLKNNNKIFDSVLKGKPFKFAVGRGEVIKAWDVGVAGMKVGGKRRITCPPHMAYGARGAPPSIPPNSTLVFEVELKGVN